jgi:hypothetical protein
VNYYFGKLSLEASYTTPPPLSGGIQRQTPDLHVLFTTLQITSLNPADEPETSAFDINSLIAEEMKHVVSYKHILPPICFTIRKF